MEQSTKLLGGISYIAIIVFSIFSSFVPFIGILSLIAAICVLVAFIQGGDQVGRPDVKTNIIVGIVLYIIATILFIFVVGAGLVAVISSSDNSGFAALGAGVIVGGIIGWILFIIGAWFWYKASAALGEGTNVGLFKAGGLVIFIGAILTIIGIGFIVMWVGEILQAIAFFTVPEKRSVSASDSSAGSI